MRKNYFVALAFLTALSSACSSAMITTVHAEESKGWSEEDGIMYWYENGVKQGTEGRGKEIYDPVSDAWYWLDAVDGGKMAVSKDVYQESQADDEGTIGKWVRYDENGQMVKGWDINKNGTYYFDPTYGTMIKGAAVIDGMRCFFDEVTGVGADKTWIVEDGETYWYENGVRQGTEGRGKEIYDPESDAWYWLDAVDDGKKAVSKDVYQESFAGEGGDIPGEDGRTYGKWVRYDENGHMIKGWDEINGNKYYFELVTGAMAKGVVTIDGREFNFDNITGILVSSSVSELKSDDYYGRNMLKSYDNSEALIRAYDKITECVENREKKVDLSDEKILASQFYTLYYAYYYDHPQHFWFDYMGYGLMDGGSGVYDTISYFCPVYWIEGKELDEAISKWETSVEELISGIDESMSEYQREKIIYDRLKDKITYDGSSGVSGESGHAWSGYAGIVEGKATCEGYTKALQYALYKVGIQSFMVSGYGINASHAWNLVRIDGNYYYCDLTYDDAEDGAGYKYFNISTDKLCENHTIDSKYITLPECNSSLE